METLVDSHAGVRRVAAGLLHFIIAGAGPASALPTGGLFSGPARPSGSSAYYNPAALANVEGPAVALIETGLITADVSYQRDGTSPFDGRPFDEAAFSVLAPTLEFSAVFETPLAPLTWSVAGFTPSAASASWPEDGPQAQHGTQGLFLSYSLVTGPVIKGKNFGFAAMVGPTFTQANLRYALDFGAYANDSARAPLFALEDPALIGFVEAQTSGWSLAATFGGWYAPTDWLRFGAGFVWVDSPQLEGELEVEPPLAFEETFPNSSFRVGSNVSLEYKLPWVFTLESEVDLGDLSIALLFQYQNKSVRDTNLFVLTETEPDILDAVVVSVTNAQDDWLVGGRVSYRVTPSLEVGVRFDVDPLSIPKETLHPINLDFTTYEFGLGGQWQINNQWMLAGTYALVWAPDLVVTESVYDPTAPGDSGFSRPSANGVYSVTAMKFLLSLRARFGD